MGGNLSTEFDGKKYEGGSIEEVVRAYVKENRNENMMNTTNKIVELALKKADLSKNSGGKTPDQLYSALKEARDNLQFGASARSYNRTGGMLMFGNLSSVPLSAMMGDVGHGDQAMFGRTRRRNHHKPRKSKRSMRRNSFGKKRRGSKKSGKNLH